MVDGIQDGQGPETWLHDWSAALTLRETDLGLTPGSLTLGSITSVVGPANTTVGTPSLNTAHTGILFTLSFTITPPVDATFTSKVVLSNSDHAQAEMIIGLR